MRTRCDGQNLSITPPSQSTWSSSPAARCVGFALIGSWCGGHAEEHNGKGRGLQHGCVKRVRSMRMDAAHCGRECYGLRLEIQRVLGRPWTLPRDRATVGARLRVSISARHGTSPLRPRSPFRACRYFLVSCCFRAVPQLRSGF